MARDDEQGQLLGQIQEHVNTLTTRLYEERTSRETNEERIVARVKLL
jgi:hypothetical protein